MNREEIATDLRQIFEKNFGSEALERLGSEQELFKFGGGAIRYQDLDSLDHVEFVMAVEDHFDIEIDDVSAAMLKTLENFVDAVETRISKPAHGDR